MSSININNKTYTGKNISINGGIITVDGVNVTPEQKQISIVVEGNIQKLSVDVCDEVTVNGAVADVQTMSGDIVIKGDVSGDVSTMSGDVDCGAITGSVTTMSGNVKHK